LEKSTFKRLTQRPSSVQLWQTPAGSLTPKEVLLPVCPRLFPFKMLLFVVPLPEEAHEASYFADDARIDSFSSSSTK